MPCAGSEARGDAGGGRAGVGAVDDDLARCSAPGRPGSRASHRPSLGPCRCTRRQRRGAASRARGGGVRRKPLASARISDPEQRSRPRSTGQRRGGAPRGERGRQPEAVERGEGSSTRRRRELGGQQPAVGGVDERRGRPSCTAARTAPLSTRPATSGSASAEKRRERRGEPPAAGAARRRAAAGRRARRRSAAPCSAIAGAVSQRRRGGDGMAEERRRRVRRRPRRRGRRRGRGRPPRRARRGRQRGGAREGALQGRRQASGAGRRAEAAEEVAAVQRGAPAPPPALRPRRRRGRAARVRRGLAVAVDQRGEDGAADAEHEEEGEQAARHRGRRGGGRDAAPAAAAVPVVGAPIEKLGAPPTGWPSAETTRQLRICVPRAVPARHRDEDAGVLGARGELDGPRRRGRASGRPAGAPARRR